MRRRDLLSGLLASAALSCQRGTPSRIEGGIVGASHARGHRVRGAPPPSPARFEDVPVAIVGAGMAGLSAAWAFERAGFHDFVLVELEDAAGGTATSGRNAVSPYPWGAHYVPVPGPANRPLVALLDEIGAVAGRDAQGRPVWAEEALCREAQERVYAFGQWSEGLFPRLGATPRDLAQLAAFEKEMKRWAAWRDAQGRPAFALPRAHGSDAAEVRAFDQVSMAEWMRTHGWDAPRLLWLVEYACRDDFGTTLAQTSAFAGVHYWAARTSDDHVAELLTWPEGNGRIVRHLSEVAGRRVRTGLVVGNVAPAAESVEVTGWDARTGEPFGLRAGHVVFALPRHVAGRVIAPWREAPPPFVAETVYGAWMVANLTLHDRPASRGFPLAWDNVLYDSPSLGYVVATHQSGRDHGPTVLTYYLPVVDDDPRAARRRLLETPWEHWVEAILTDLRAPHPNLRELVQRADVWLWGHAMVRPRPGFLFSDALAAARRPLGRVHFAHTDLSGMALLEEAQYHGIAAAEAVLRARGHAFTSWLS